MPWNWKLQKGGFSTYPQGIGQFSEGVIRVDPESGAVKLETSGPTFVRSKEKVPVEKPEIPTKPEGGSSDSEWITFWKDHLGEERKYQEELYKRGQILKGIKGIQQGMDKWQLGGPRLAAAAGSRIADRWGTMKIPEFVTSPAVAPQITSYSFQDFIRV